VKPQKHWSDVAHRQEFILELLIKKGLVKPSQIESKPSGEVLGHIYKLTYADFLRNGGPSRLLLSFRQGQTLLSAFLYLGLSLLGKYKRSVPTAVMESFPEHDWKYWKFGRSENGWWMKLGQKLNQRDPSAIKIAKEYVEEHLGLSQTLLESKKFSTKSFKPTDLARVSILGGLAHLLHIVYRADPTPPSTYDR